MGFQPGSFFGIALLRQCNIRREVEHTHNTRRRRVTALSSKKLELRNTFQRKTSCGDFYGVGELFFRVFFFAVGSICVYTVFAAMCSGVLQLVLQLHQSFRGKQLGITVVYTYTHIPVR